MTAGGEAVSEVVVGRDLTETVCTSVAAAAQVAILCQPSTAPLADRYATALGAVGVEAFGLTLPDGEDAKRLQVVEDIYRALNSAALTRGDVVLAVGGGALTDVAGFAAATYLRGVDAVYVPTTLLGAVDAAIGGKTAVNVDGKNLAGAFAHPTRVIVDVDTLDRLAPRLKTLGAAEALKTGFIADMEIVRAYEQHGHDVDLEDIVNRSVAVKTSVVSEDFTELGVRAHLNYGHTVGHAIETVTGCHHGEAVSVGMVAAGAASAHELGFDGSQRQKDVLATVGLPTSLPVRGVSPHREQLMSLMALDKKRDREGVRLVLLERFGSPVVVPATDATVHAAFAAIGVGT
jgi:3-dehydroquinate synthase/shikimate kinase/3-dehydroquinate synthase